MMTTTILDAEYVVLSMLESCIYHSKVGLEINLTSLHNVTRTTASLCRSICYRISYVFNFLINDCVLEFTTLFEVCFKLVLFKLYLIRIENISNPNFECTNFR